MKRGDRIMTLALTVLAFGTALLSGVFGMAGGMILMGAFAALLPMATAMVLHGAVQLVSNGVRAALLWRAIHARGLGFYLGGALLSCALLFPLRYVPDPSVVYLGLGLAPFVAALLPPRALDFERPRGAFLCGLQVTALNLTAGAAGPLLDVAFVDSRLSRTQVVATKGITQVCSHGLKLAYFGAFLTDGAPVGAGVALGLLLATLLGTRAGTFILEALSESTFRRWSRGIVYAIGATYLCKAAASF
jgi:uncharacterized membrane protein YfcA